MPVGNKPSPWKDDLTQSLAERYEFTPSCFPKAWRSDRGKKITLEDVIWLINNVNDEYPFD
jgi:hypothetical protein